MNTFIEEVVIQTAVNLISVIIIFVLGYLWILFSGRRKLFRIFGISQDKPFVSIYVSRLQIIPRGTLAVGSEDINRGYIGPAINYVEYEGARAIRNEIQSKRLILVPKGVRGLLESLFGQNGIRQWLVEASIEPSPLYLRTSDYRSALPGKQNLESAIIRQGLHEVWRDYQLPDDAGDKIQLSTHQSDTNLILLGNGLYNIYTQYYDRDGGKHKLPFCFKREDSDEGSCLQLKIRTGWGEYNLPGRKPDTKRPDSHELGVVHRFKDEDNGIIVILCAGTGSRATKAAACWLAANWRSLTLPKDTETLTIYLREDVKGNDPDDGDVGDWRKRRKFHFSPFTREELRGIEDNARRNHQ